MRDGQLMEAYGLMSVFVGVDVVSARTPLLRASAQQRDVPEVDRARRLNPSELGWLIPLFQRLSISRCLSTSGARQVQARSSMKDSPALLDLRPPRDSAVGIDGNDKEAARGELLCQVGVSFMAGETT